MVAPKSLADVCGPSRSFGGAGTRLLPIKWFGIFLVACIAHSAASAQEVLVLGGVTRDNSSRDQTYGWALEYAHGLGEHAYVTLSWLNEGHVLDHHRDGQAAQIWGRVNLLDRRLSLAAGIGPYRYFDTTQAAQGAQYENDDGWGLIYSVAATWYTQSRWLMQLRANRIETPGAFDSTSLLFGVGYQLDAPDSRGPLAHAPVHTGRTTRNEVALSGGRSILNSFGSEGATAFSLEYRRGLATYVDWTLGWLYEATTTRSAAMA
jgi:hypothetical protein